MTIGLVSDAPVLVLGLGNLLLLDDAAGLRLLEDLSRDSKYAEEDVEFVDGGTQGLALLGYLNDRKAIIILDAVGLGAAPGTVHLLDSDEVAALGGRRATTSHEGNALELLATARLFWEDPPRITLVGIEPGQIATGIGLSPAVEAARPQALAMARKVLAEMVQAYVPCHTR